MAEETRTTVSEFLKGIDRYNPENLTILEQYVHQQVSENAYDLDANLAVLKLYQFNPAYYQATITMQILLKSLMTLPNADFIMCRCLIDDANICAQQNEPSIGNVIKLADLLETCNFVEAWKYVAEHESMVEGIMGFHEAIRTYITYVIGITYQSLDVSLVSNLLGDLQGEELERWISDRSWVTKGDKVFITNQEEHIKSKNIAEKLDFDSVAAIIAQAR